MRSLLLASLVFLATPVAAENAPRQLTAQLQRDLEADPSTRITMVWSDLNADGRDEALVFVEGGGWCGSGGCRLMVYEQQGSAFVRRGHIRTSRRPIGLASSSSSGWRDLVVWSSGGGDLYGRLSIVPFDGAAYAAGSSGAPSRPLEAGATIEVIMPSGDPGELLWAEPPPRR